MGDADVLRELGLDYNRLRSLDDPMEVARHIVDAVCGPLSDGTIEDEERRAVAAEVTQWVLEANADGAPPTPEEIVRTTIAEIVFEAFATETADRLHRGEQPAWAGQAMDRQVREAAEALADRVALSPAGPTPAEFAQAVEQSLEALRNIFGGDA